ncbi:ArsR/SmtB family transcription factor [Angustibacter sp. McL0619]|uniref:ArsR/SmtB family transcription factor n=1 Tax=Angustibacter sp. McL0619 TaxID=3415676 RepID=UPI003CF5B7FF
MADPFTVVAEPTRRRILAELRGSDCSVGELVERLGLPQPTVSKHLKVLRDNRFVLSRGDAQRRIYRLDGRAFAELETWLTPYRQYWEQQLDRLQVHLDEDEES